jgi:glutamine amidotransferase
MTDVAVIDYGMGNLHSVAKALEHAGPGLEVTITGDPAVVKRAGRVVFPGQGAMPDCVREMDARGLRAAVLEAARTRPFLGICIGLQMLFDVSEEGNTPGLGLMPGRVRRFPASAMVNAEGIRLKVPHMGWNEVRQTLSHPLWDGIPQGSRFYFVHSYFPHPENRELTAGESVYGIPFTCAAARDNLFGVQFHPEKSESAGLRLFANFLAWRPSPSPSRQATTASPAAR